jgi:hypothetical protein
MIYLYPINLSSIPVASYDFPRLSSFVGDEAPRLGGSGSADCVLPWHLVHQSDRRGRAPMVVTVPARFSFEQAPTQLAPSSNLDETY